MKDMAESRKKKQKQCGVCGDIALGSNFNAITCESCKAFFRRNAVKTKEFVCPFENNCKVDMVTRRFCQKCRLKKCFDIGMKKEWIMSEEERQAKRIKIEKNRQKRSRQSDPLQEYNGLKAESPEDSLMLASPISSMSPMTPQTPGSVSLSADVPQNQMFSHQPLTPSDCEYSPPTKLLNLEQLADAPQGDAVTDDSFLQLDKSNASDSRSFKSESLHSMQNSGEESNSTMFKSKPNGCGVTSYIKSESLMQSAFTKAIEIEFSELPIRTSDSKELTTLERQRLEELITANEVLKMPLICGFNDPSLIDVINMTDHAIRRLIKMSKKINSFKNLCQDDQIALLKGGCTELMILRSVMSYIPEKDCWQGPEGPKIMSIKVDILKEARGNVYEEHKRFINSFHPRWRSDENIMLILSGIALFTPERPNTVHKDSIKLEQDTYYYLLRRYLDSICNSCEAKSMFIQLIHKIEELHILNENHVRVYLDVNPKDVEPLLIEIFDLKH